MTKRVLIIEDDEDIRDMAKLALEDTAGWSVRSTPDGASGVKAAQGDPPDVILLDYMMPGMDGIRVLGELKKHRATRGIPVVMITAKTETGLLARLDEAGAVGHVTKPFDPMTLAQKMKRLLGWPDAA